MKLIKKLFFGMVCGLMALVLALLFFDRDAVWPMTEKYRMLAKEHEALLEAKKTEKEGQDTPDKQADNNIETKQETSENNG